MTAMMIRLHKQELDKAITIGNLEEAKRRVEDLIYFMNEYKKETGREYQLEDTSAKTINSLIKMDRETAELAKRIG